MSARAVVRSVAAFALLGCSAPEARAPLPSRATAAPATPPSASSAALLATPRPTPVAPAAAPPPPPRAGAEIAVPAGRVRLGSPTGSALRNPAREADALALDVPAFSIDALPYPNDPNQPPRASVTRDEAARLCAEQDKRLCSEIEWERACKGDQEASYPLDPRLGEFSVERCARQPGSCASVLGVFALGTLGREWTASRAGRADWDRLRSASVRGAAKDALAPAHRCAARDAAAPESRSESLLFRCCRGAPFAADYPEQPDPPAFRPLALKDDEIRPILARMPETEALAASFRLQRASELTQALSGRSSDSLAPWQLASPALAWSPLRGEELVVLSGSTPAGALLVVYYPLPDGGARFAGSYVTRDEQVPILVAYKPDARDELLYSTCWGCGGEGGALRLDAEARVRFLPR